METTACRSPEFFAKTSTYNYFWFPPRPAFLNGAALTRFPVTNEHGLAEIAKRNL
jgi:hypothetical protein